MVAVCPSQRSSLQAEREEWPRPLQGTKAPPLRAEAWAGGLLRSSCAHLPAYFPGISGIFNRPAFNLK